MIITLLIYYTGVCRDAVTPLILIIIKLRDVEIHIRKYSTNY